MLNLFYNTKEEFSMILQLILELIMLFQQLVGDMIKNPINNIGLLETHGVNIGEN